MKPNSIGVRQGSNVGTGHYEPWHKGKIVGQEAQFKLALRSSDISQGARHIEKHLEATGVQPLR
jgi:hypothetical protein